MMTASKDFRQPAGHTSSAGWIVSLPYYRHRGNVYFSLQASMECLGLQSHLKKNGFKFIDKFVSENGLNNCFILGKNQRERKYISYAAFVLMAIKFQSATNNPIRKYLLGPVLLPSVTMMCEHEIIPTVRPTVSATLVRPTVTPTPVRPTAPPTPVPATPVRLTVTPTPVSAIPVRPTAPPTPVPATPVRLTVMLCFPKPHGRALSRNILVTA